jgi:hypothetical protein
MLALKDLQDLINEKNPRLTGQGFSSLKTGLLQIKCGFYISAPEDL